MQRHPTGTTPGGWSVDSGDPMGLKVGIITRVDEVHLKADLRVITGGGDRVEIDLTQAMAGPRSFWGGVPEVNSLVVIGYRRRSKQLTEAVILGYIPVGTQLGVKFDPFSVGDPGDVTPDEKEAYDKAFGPPLRYKRMKLKPGDVGGMSASGAEFALTRDVRMANRAGDMMEFRDAERSIVSQTLHRVTSDAGVYRLSGAARRGSYWLPDDIFGPTKSNSKYLKDTADRYYGREVLQHAGPGDIVGGSTKMSDIDGKTLDAINNETIFPPITFSNGRRYFYPSTVNGQGLEDYDSSIFIGTAFTEDRTEISHTTDLVQEVRDEIDGFAMDRPNVYIERVYGTVIGNSPFDGMGQRQYGAVLKPTVFDTFMAFKPGSLKLQTISTDPTKFDIESTVLAGAHLFRVVPPRYQGDQFAFAVSKQGKAFLNIPASTVEEYGDGEKNVSLDAMFKGAIKAYIGASKPTNVSLHLTLEGGVVADIGHRDSGQAIDVRYHSSVRAVYDGAQDDDDYSYQEDVQGNKASHTSGNSDEIVDGAKSMTVNGNYRVMADSVTLTSFFGYSLQTSDLNTTVSGKSQYNYALVVLENIALGGKISTILAGGLIQNIVAGAMTYNVLGGATLFNNAAGAFTISVGAGAIAVSTGAGAVALSTAAGAMSLAAGAGAVAITAGLAMNLLAGVAVNIISPQVLVGGPAAALGVCRGLPMMPPGTPSLDWITGIPLQGSASFRSLN